MVSICRLCASLKKTENLTFIRDSDHDLCSKLLKCCQLSIDFKDILPKGVCPECVAGLNTSFEFYERVHESNESLKELYLGESLSKGTNKLVDDATEQKSLAIVAAGAATGDKKPFGEFLENSNDSNEQVIARNAGIKNEQTCYLIIDSATEDDPQKGEGLSEKDIEHANLSPDNILVTDNFASVEFIEDDEEHIDFEPSYYEIIEHEEEEEDEAEEGEEEQEETLMEDETETEVIEFNEIVDSKSDDSKSEEGLPLNKVENDDTWTQYPWKCIRCLHVASSPKELCEHGEKVHQLRATDIYWFCADCQKTFERYHTLINHIRQRHRTGLALFCDVCNANCKSFGNLAKHRQEKHNDKDDLPICLCGVCGKGFYTKNSLQIHSKCHLPEDLRAGFKCDLCGKKLRTKSNLRFHMKMHTGTRDYVCDQCGKKFVQKANLEEHLVSHVSFTPYECTLCDKFFKTPERLTRHKRRHTDEKPFTCSVCQKTFRTKDAMSTHMRVHTGEMPFSCEFCQKPFRFRSTLMTHRNGHTGTRPYSCLDCNHHFTNWPNYNKHMKRRHGVNLSSRNPRGPKEVKKETSSTKALIKPTVSSPATTTKSNSNVKSKAHQDIRDEDEEVIVGAEYKPEENINIIVLKEEKEEPGDNYEDAIR